MAIKTKYHNSPNGPRICTAEVRECIYGNAGEAHYSNYEEAQTAYEEAQVEKYGQTSVLSKSDKLVQNAHKAYYISRERGVKKINKTNSRIKAHVRLAKATPEVKQAKADFNELMTEVQSMVNNSEKKAKQFKNRIIGNYRFARLRTKEFINLNKDKYTKLSNSAIKFKDDLKVAKNVGVNRARGFVSESKGRLKAASSHQKAALNALRNSSPEKAEQQNRVELTKLSESTHSISPKVVDNYFKSMEEAQRGRRRAEKSKSFSVSQGKRRAIVDETVDV